MEGRRLSLCLFLVMFFMLVYGDGAPGSASQAKAYPESRWPPELKLVGRKLSFAVESHGVAEQLTASRNTVLVAEDPCGGVGRRRSIHCDGKLRRRISREEWNNNDFVAFNADYKPPKHHPPKNN